MDEEKKEVTEETKENLEEKTEEETKEPEETKEDFTKEEVVPAGKYNQAIRKQRESDLEKRELEKQLAEAKKAKPEKEESEDEKEDIFKEETPDIDHLIDEKFKPVLERLSRRENDDRKNQRDTFFTKHPEYLDAKKWNELLDEVDNSLNPNSKDNHYTQLEKAHRILTGESGYSEIDKKKKELASDSASKGDGANKPEGKKPSDDREDRLSRQMPKGYEFKQ